MASASSHNGGLTQINLSFLQTDGAFPFLNCLKTAQYWSYNSGSSPVTPDTLDSDGYPSSIVNGGVFTVFYVPKQTDRPGNYVIKWDGNGTITLGMNNTLVSGSLTSTLGSGRYVFSTTDSRFVIRIVTITGPSITNVRVCHVDDEASLDANNVYSDKFKQKLLEANFGVIRFLGWQKGNTTNITTWATRKAATHFSYHCDERRPTLFAGTTTNVGNVYSCSAPASWSGLVDKATVHVVFNASATQSGTCTLNVAGTGDINMLNEYSNALGASSYPVGGATQSFATLAYDALLNAWIKQGGCTSLGSMGLQSGVPFELMVQLCAEVGAHPYFVAPPLACTPMTDWHTQASTYTRDNGPSWMIPRFEGPNELWNTFANFFQTTYAKSIATAYGWGTDYHNWYGKVLSTMGQAVSAVYGGDRSRYQILCGVQTTTGDTTGGANSSDPRLSSAKYIGTTPQSGYSSTVGVAEAYRWVTHAACAQYYNPSSQGSAAETTLTTAFSGKAFTASISGNVMTVTAIKASNGAALSVGDTIFGNQVFQSGNGPIPTSVTITSLGTGTGGIGTYNLSASLTVASMNMTAAADLTAPATYADTVNSGSGNTTLSKCATLYNNWKTWAAKFGVNRICGYEGGYSPDYSGFNGNSQTDMLKAASKLDSNLVFFTRTNYNNFINGGAFQGEFPSHLTFSGNPDVNGYSGDVWSLMENIYQSPNSPQWEGIRLFNARRRRLILVANP